MRNYPVHLMKLPLLVEAALFPGRIARRRAALARERPVVLMGRGKSGTRLLAWSCFHLGVATGSVPRLPAGDVDSRYFRQTIKALAQRHFAAEAPPQSGNDLEWFQFAADVALRRLKRLSPHAPAWGWKWPETYLIPQIVHATFPEARYIHMVRDGRDVAFKRHLTDDLARPLGHTLMTHLNLRDEPRYVRAARSWEYQVRKYRRFAAGLPPRQHLEFTYEEFCSAPVPTMQRIADFLELPFGAACREWVQRNIVAKDLRQYRRAPPEQVRAVEALIGGTLAELGYCLEYPPAQAS
jgi:hypothetical protein